jgi:hypothetical protein
MRCCPVEGDTDYYQGDAGDVLDHPEHVEPGEQQR